MSQSLPFLPNTSYFELLHFSTWISSMSGNYRCPTVEQHWIWNGKLCEIFPGLEKRLKKSYFRVILAVHLSIQIHVMWRDLVICNKQNVIIQDWALNCVLLSCCSLRGCAKVKRLKNKVYMLEMVISAIMREKGKLTDPHAKCRKPYLGRA